MTQGGGWAPVGPPQSPQQWSPAPATEPSRRRIWTSLAFFVAVVVALVVVFAIAAPEQFRRLLDAADPRNTQLNALTVGQCFDGGAPSSSSEPEIAFAVRVKDCGEPHDGELYAVLQHPDGPYPGDDALTRYANAQCAQRFEGYVGIDFERSSLEVAFFYPLARSWLTGDRAIQCFVTAKPGERLTTSVKGARR